MFEKENFLYFEIILLCQSKYKAIKDKTINNLKDNKTGFSTIFAIEKS